jgi:hypothetical protein
MRTDAHERELLLKLAEAMVEVLGNLFDGRLISDDDNEMAALRLEIGYRRQELLGMLDCLKERDCD